MTSASRHSAPPADDRSRLIAALATLLFVIGLTITVLYMKLTYIPAAQQTWPPADSSELLFEGEYVMQGDIAEPAHEAESAAEEAAVEEPSTSGTDMRDEGTPAPAPSPVMTSERESPMKVTPPKEEPVKGPSKAEIEAQKAKEKARNETQQKIAGRMKFGSNTSSGSGAGKSGSPDGNASTGALSGAPGFSLAGRSLAHWVKPVKTAPNGSVTLRVVVDQQGNVIQASVASSSGAAANETVRQACIVAAKKCRFSVDLNANARQSGTITYRFVSK